MTSLLDEIRAEVIPNGPQCSIGPALASLDDESRQAVHAAHDEKVHATAIARWLGKRNVNVKPEALRRHLNGGCSCPTR